MHSEHGVIGRTIARAVTARDDALNQVDDLLRTQRQLSEGWEDAQLRIRQLEVELSSARRQAQDERVAAEHCRKEADSLRAVNAELRKWVSELQTKRPGKAAA